MSVIAQQIENKKNGNAKNIDPHAEHRELALKNFLVFCQAMYHLRTGRKFELTTPPGRESHYITIARALTNVLLRKTTRLIIALPPRYGKSECVIHFIAWALAHYPDSNFIYVSYAHSLAKRQTQTVRDIIAMPEFSRLFGVSVREDSSAKDNFITSAGGNVFAAGAGGSITGRGAGIQNAKRFAGAIIIDDIHKPDEVTSDTVRNGIKDWYYNTLQSRINQPETPIIFIGHRLHEDDLASSLLKSGEWESVILPALDEANNPLHPTMHDLKALKKLQEESPYVYASQYQQNPQPAGGGIYKPEWFPLMDFEPEILATFITADTAETDKDYNDATVFSFWGLYRPGTDAFQTDMYALHWLACEELRIEPCDLQNAFLQFYANCMRYRVKPRFAAIEKKSTGTTLLSTLKSFQGLSVLDIERTRASGSKITRFLEVQPYISAKLVSLPSHGRHTARVLEHMRKITANDTHRFDDIADTCADAIRIALIDKLIPGATIPANKLSPEHTRALFSQYARIENLKKSAYKI